MVSAGKGFGFAGLRVGRCSSGGARRGRPLYNLTCADRSAPSLAAAGGSIFRNDARVRE